MVPRYEPVTLNCKVKYLTTIISYSLNTKLYLKELFSLGFSTHLMNFYRNWFQADGIPTPSITWFKDGEPLKNEQGLHRMILPAGGLFFLKVSSNTILLSDCVNNIWCVLWKNHSRCLWHKLRHSLASRMALFKVHYHT